MTKNKGNISDFFNVDFDESEVVSLEDGLSSPSQTSTQKSNDTYNQNANFKVPRLFKNPKGWANHDFDVDFEESDQVLTQNTQSSQASSTSLQKSTDAFSQVESKKQPLFQDRKTHTNNAFEVDFEESLQHETGGHSQNTQVSQSSESNEENVEDISVRFGKPDPFAEAKQRRLNKPFDVDFEESNNITDVLSNSRATPTMSKVLPFRKSSRVTKDDDFDVNFNETEVETEVETNVDGLTGKSVTGPVRSASPVTTPDFTTSKGEVTQMNITEPSREFNQSSFNDENMRGWMSDHSEDEIPTDQRVEMERISLPPNEIPAPPDTAVEEDHMQQLQLKLREIIDNARNGKVVERSMVISRQNIPENPKRLEKKRKVSAKPSLRKPAPFATKRLYNHIITKIRPKYGIDSVVQAEELVISICDVVKIVSRRKNYQKKLVNDLKLEMAKMGVIETTYQFYEFVREFLPYEFRLKVVPCIQPGTNIVYPPKDAINPFEKIL